MQSHKPNILPVLSQETYDLIDQFRKDINNSQAKLGERLHEVLKDSDLTQLTTLELIDALFKTIPPGCSSFTGSYYSRPLNPENYKYKGSILTDWTSREKMLLQSMNKAVEDVTVFSRETNSPQTTDAINEKATFLFYAPANAEDVFVDEKFSYENYEKQLRKTMLPALLFANENAGNYGAIITLRISDHETLLTQSIEKFVNDNSELFPNIKGIVFVVPGLTDKVKFKKIRNEKSIPIVKSTRGIELNPDIGLKRRTFVLVPGNYLSFPGGKYDGFQWDYERKTSLLTNIHTRITGSEGEFDAETMQYQPQSGASWMNECEKNKSVLSFAKVKVYNNEGACVEAVFRPGEHYKPNYLGVSGKRVIEPEHVETPFEYVTDRYFIALLMLLPVLVLTILGVSIGLGVLAATGGLATMIMLPINMGFAGIGVGLVGSTAAGFPEFVIRLERWARGKTATEAKADPGFLERNPWLVNLMTGVLIGLIIVGTIAAYIATCGAAAPIAGVSFAAVVGLLGSVGITVGVGAGIVGACATLGVFIGEITRLCGKGCSSESSSPGITIDENAFDKPVRLDDDSSGKEVRFRSKKSDLRANSRFKQPVVVEKTQTPSNQYQYTL